MAGMISFPKPAEDEYAVKPEDRLRQIVDLYASNGSFADTGRILDLDPQAVRRIIKSPQGSFALEQTLRERARTRALRPGATTDRLIDELDAILDRGDERILNGRRDGDPLTVFLRPGLRDVVSGLAWSTHHMREISETLSAIDVTNHDVSHEARSHNLATLKELVALEERRLALDNERQVADESQSHDPPVVDTFAATPYSRNSWGGNRSIHPQRESHRAHKERWPDALAARAQQDIAEARAAAASLPSPSDGVTDDPGLCSSGADASGEVMSSTSEGADSPVITGGRQPQVEAPLMRQARDFTGESRGSRDRPPTPRPTREAASESSPQSGTSAASESSPGIRSSNDAVTWEDLEEE